MLEELENDLLARASTGVGWFVFLLGFIVLSGMAVIEFFTATNTPWYEKLMIACFTLGPLDLLATVVRQRMLTYKNDNYRKVKL